MIAAAITLYDLVPAGSVLDQHGPYGDPAFPTVGTNATFAATTDQPTEDTGLAGVIGWTQPAQAATDPAVDIPGVGFGTAVAAGDPVIPVTDLDDIDCDLSPIELCASIGQTKRQKFVPTLDGNPLDLSGRTLSFVVEDENGIDLETGPAVQSGENDTPAFEVSLVASTAHAKDGVYRWAVRDDATQAVVGHGKYIVEYFPIAGDTISPTSPTAASVDEVIQIVLEAVGNPCKDEEAAAGGG